MFGISVNIDDFYETYPGSETGEQQGLKLSPRHKYMDRLPDIYISSVGITQVFSGEQLMFPSFNEAFAKVFRDNKKLFLEG